MWVDLFDNINAKVCFFEVFNEIVTTSNLQSEVVWTQKYPNLCICI